MGDMDFRRESLDQALRTAQSGEAHDDIINRARDYYQYISGKSPDHRPPPAIAMEARQGTDPKGLDGEAATARAEGIAQEQPE
jgi:hypothetical protein